MKNAISENSKTVLDYLIANEGTQMTAADIAEALDMKVSSVNGIVTSGLCRKTLAERDADFTTVEVEGSDKPIKVKFIRVTEAGKAYDHEAALAADEAAKDAE